MRFVPITRAHVAALLLAAGITTTAALAALPAKDGTLPMYLHAAQIPGSKDIPSDVWAQGPTLLLFTTDSVGAVDAWYRSHLGSYVRKTIPSGVKYSGPGGFVRVTATSGADARYGHSAILIGPKS